MNDVSEYRAGYDAAYMGQGFNRSQSSAWRNGWLDGHDAREMERGAYEASLVHGWDD